MNAAPWYRPRGQIARQYQRPVKEARASRSNLREAASAGSGRRLTAVNANIAITRKSRSKTESETRIAHPLLRVMEHRWLLLCILADPCRMVACSLATGCRFIPPRLKLGHHREMETDEQGG